MNYQNGRAEIIDKSSGVTMAEKLISLIIAPLLVGLVLLLVDRWLDD
ncbi:type I toxin-antitoxin system Fst family toxin [Enterococcus faecalis]